MKTERKKIGFILGTGYNPEDAQIVANQYINKSESKSEAPNKKRETDPDTTRQDPIWENPKKEKENDRSGQDDDNDKTGPDTDSDKTK